MAEIFVSPGVYVRERDFSFYVSSVGTSSLALIGETQKGPAFHPTLVNDMGEFREKFGDLDPNKLTGYAAKSFFKYANSAYVVRVLGNESLRSTMNILPIVETGGTVLATLLCSASTASVSISGTDATDNIYLQIAGIYSGEVSLTDSSAPNYLPTLFPRTNQPTATSVATQHVFPNEATAAMSVGAALTSITAFEYEVGSPLDVEGYSNAHTPVIVSDVVDGTSQGTSLFTIHTQSDGVQANKDVKIAIENIDTATTSFDVVVRSFADTNDSPIVLERFAKVNLDKDSRSYIARMIGDSMDEETAEFPLISNYIYVEMETNDQNQLKDLLPYGFNPVNAPMSGSSYSFPEFTMVTSYDSSVSMRRQWLGLNYTTTSSDLLMSNASSVYDIDNSSNKSLKGFHLNSTASATYYQVGPSASTLYTKSNAKFLVPVLGGNDGWPYYETSRDLLGGSPTTGETAQYKSALDEIANPEAYDINLLAVPGVAIDSTIGSYAIEIAETRADCLYIGDMPSAHATATAAATVTSSLDTNYACTYWPYVKIYDADNEKDVVIPPTPQALEAMAYTDSVSYPWFAPAGLNRGLLTDVIRAKYKLTQDDRETLYEAKINPVVTFPGQGISIWGQKTLQTRNTALDRINVRRMLLYVEKVIAGASKYLVFEQNDEATWDRFKALVQPVLDTVRIKRGLVDFRVIMDETTNTPDVIDRNEMVGQIYIKPTKTAEAIYINFNIVAQGATFEE